MNWGTVTALAITAVTWMIASIEIRRMLKEGK